MITSDRCSADSEHKYRCQRRSFVAAVFSAAEIKLKKQHFFLNQETASPSHSFCVRGEGDALLKGQSTVTHERREAVPVSSGPSRFSQLMRHSLKPLPRAEIVQSQLSNRN